MALKRGVTGFISLSLRLAGIFPITSSEGSRGLWDCLSGFFPGSLFVRLPRSRALSGAERRHFQGLCFPQQVVCLSGLRPSASASASFSVSVRLCLMFHVPVCLSVCASPFSVTFSPSVSVQLCLSFLSFLFPCLSLCLPGSVCLSISLFFL